MAKFLIRNGRVLDPGTRLDQTADVLIEDTVIRGIGPNLDRSGAEVFDADGLVVTPGFIDMHVHLREPGFEHAETIESGARAASAGGFTTVCCMPNTSPVNDSATVTSYIVERARRSAIVNVFPIGAITKGSKGEELASMGAMKTAGIVAVSDDGLPVMNARVMRRAMEYAKAFDLPLINHCEDLNLSAGGSMHEGFESLRLGLFGIPSAAEDVMVARDILLAELTGAQYHVAHISTTHSIAMVGFAKARGLAVTCEATPHHFAVADCNMQPYDSNYKMKPPLRACGDVQSVINGLMSGTIDVIATDHAPHPGSEKMQEFERCPFGITGLETAIGLAFEKLVNPGLMPLMRVVEAFTLAPATILKLNDRGRLAPGLPADITILDPSLEWTYDVNKSQSRSRNTPFDGHSFKGGPVATIVAGSIVYAPERRT
jgi:dihydroorotase